MLINALFILASRSLMKTLNKTWCMLGSPWCLLVGPNGSVSSLLNSIKILDYHFSKTRWLGQTPFYKVISGGCFNFWIFYIVLQLIALLCYWVISLLGIFPNQKLSHKTAIIQRLPLDSTGIMGRCKPSTTPNLQVWWRKLFIYLQYLHLTIRRTSDGLK